MRSNCRGSDLAIGASSKYFLKSLFSSRNLNTESLANKWLSKRFFKLKNVRKWSGKSAKVRVDMLTIIYNSLKLAVDRIDTVLNQQVASSDLDIRRT